ncbi:hypothetical protein AMTR_s00015p00196620, partial [Amborella trichopoda]
EFKKWILKTIKETWNLFQDKFIDLWKENWDRCGDVYPAEIYSKPELRQQVQQKYMQDLFHDTLGFGGAKMIRRIVGVAHVEDLESIQDAAKRADCEHQALELAKMIVKERRNFQTIDELLAVIIEKNVPTSLE